MLSWFNCVTLCDPMDHSLSGSSVSRQNWSGVTFSSQGDLPSPCLLHLLHWQAGSLPLAPPGKPQLEGRDHVLTVMTCPVSSRQLGRQEVSITAIWQNLKFVEQMMAFSN